MGQANNTSGGNGAANRQRRVSFGCLPEPMECAEFQYAKRREFIAPLKPAQEVDLIMRSEAFERHVLSHLERIDSTASSRGPQREYSARQLEAVFIYARCMACARSRRRWSTSVATTRPASSLISRSGGWRTGPTI